MPQTRLQVSRFRRAVLGGLALLLTTALPAAAQDDLAPPPVYRPYYGWRHYYGPTDAISNRIHAQADWVRSVGESAVSHAQARRLRADAFRREIANSVEYARAYWDKKEIYRAAKMRTYTAPLDAADLRNNQTWRRLRDHAELTPRAIENGNALNFLLDRFSTELLAAHYSLTDVDPALQKRLVLPDNVLAKLRVREDLPGGKGLVFKVNSGETLNVDRWPFALRDARFKKQREEFEQARDAIVQARQNGGTVDNAAVKRLLKAHDDLDNAFYKHYTRENRTRSSADYFDQFLTSKRYLQSLAGEIARLQELGDAAEFENSNRFDGDNLIALVSHMSRHGLKFAPAETGDEPAYHETFYIMRDLYLTVADDDKNN